MSHQIRRSQAEPQDQPLQTVPQPETSSQAPKLSSGGSLVMLIWSEWASHTRPQSLTPLFFFSSSFPFEDISFLTVVLMSFSLPVLLADEGLQVQWLLHSHMSLKNATRKMCKFLFRGFRSQVLPCEIQIQSEMISQGVSAKQPLALCLELPDKTAVTVGVTGALYDITQGLFSAPQGTCRGVDRVNTLSRKTENLMAKFSFWLRPQIYISNVPTQ